MPLLDISDKQKQNVEAALFFANKKQRPKRGSSESTLRIVHIIKHCNYANGNVHVAVDLACEQAKEGYEVTFVSRGGTFEPLLAQHGVLHVYLPHEQSKPASLLKAAWHLTKLVRKTRPNVLHAHMMASALIGYVASRIAGMPLITTVHNSFDKHSVIMRLGDRVVAVSRAERKQLLNKGYNSKRVVAVMNAPNRSPRETFIKDKEEVTLQSPCILAANGLHRRKGVSDLIVACRQLFEEIPDWRLYIAGEGPDRETLEQQVHQAGIADRVHFLGFRSAPRPLMEQSDIFVLASYADPCSLAIGEARSAGCAIVATRVGGTPEMLEYGTAGRLVTPGNPDELAQELRTLMLDDEGRRKLRRAALQGSSIFDVQRLVEDYEQVYRSAITCPRG
ncbi:glycosyltransferase family 4 protein [Granulicella arctica]|uniref:Glycosyltransferase involved in cell wall biosynthesis n=1 Tax=Granulicella arctica TaxID=940613 RepID=A0A7Y9THI7_9BACT|nr:glycosyltransferase family 4 protein [Granulicella arctica]NYF79930.1 glycosyltransferase involved in cell wall biosynthesis [Granulicella arctica]